MVDGYIGVWSRPPSEDAKLGRLQRKHREGRACRRSASTGRLPWSEVTVHCISTGHVHRGKRGRSWGTRMTHAEAAVGLMWANVESWRTATDDWPRGAVLTQRAAATYEYGACVGLNMRARQVCTVLYEVTTRAYDGRWSRSLSTATRLVCKGSVRRAADL